MEEIQAQEKAHGIRKALKILLIFLFVLIGGALITLGIMSITNGWDQHITFEEEEISLRWLSIVNIIFGSMLLTSFFFLNQKREGFFKIIKIIMVIVFVIIGIILIASNIYCLVKGYTTYIPADIGEEPSDIKWLIITNLVLGCCLLSAPVMLKK